MAIGVPLVPLPTQQVGVEWPTEAWPQGEAAAGVEDLVDEMFSDTGRYGVTYATVVIQGGRMLLERYANAIPKWEGSPTPVTPDTPLLSWSMAKSIVHAAVGVLVARGLLDVNEPAPVPQWQTPDDPRRLVTLEDLLTMRDGLAFVEDYIDGSSDVVTMLYGAGMEDVASFAADRPLAHPPSEVFNYSSGTTNILARVVGDVIGGGAQEYEAFLRDELFAPIGMATARPKFDAAGTFVGSSYVFATARDFARFGLLYLRDGVWDGRRILPAGWVDHARRARSVDTGNGRLYGAQWWVVGDEHGGFWANGYEGQSIMCVPALDLLVLRFGKTDASCSDHLFRWRAAVTAAFA